MTSQFKFQTKEHYLGSDYKAYDVLDQNGTVIGVIQQYSGYVDTKSRGSRIVSKRRVVKMWSHCRAVTGSRTSFRHRSRNAALESMTWMIR
jgi:hypothetical protein